MPSSNVIFVFGSNLAGRHGRGSAYVAKVKWHARQGEGRGRTGQAYAIPTKNHQMKVMRIERIKFYVDEFILYARAFPNLRFHVVKIGCGLAGFSEERIAPLFADAPSNCDLPEGWRKPKAVT